MITDKRMTISSYFFKHFLPISTDIKTFWYLHFFCSLHIAAATISPVVIGMTRLVHINLVLEQDLDIVPIFFILVKSYTEGLLNIYIPHFTDFFSANSFLSFIIRKEINEIIYLNLLGILHQNDWPKCNGHSHSLL